MKQIEKELIKKKMIVNNIYKASKVKCAILSIYIYIFIHITIDIAWEHVYLIASAPIRGSAYICVPLAQLHRVYFDAHKYKSESAQHINI